MGILVDENTRVLVQGMTGREGSFHTRGCIAYGTKVVAGVTPGRGGQLFDDKVPVFDSVEQAVRETEANVSLIFVPPAFAADAIVESADSSVPLIVCITEGIPELDMVRVARYLESKPVRLNGANCPGLITPGARCKVGIMPGNIHLPGRTGVVSRSGTLTYEAVAQLTEFGVGQSSCVGIGGDRIIGTSFMDVLRLFNDDPETDMVVLIGEIGGTMEQRAAAYIKEEFTKPVCALVVGAGAPPGKRMGHAGAIITGSSGRAETKMEALRAAGASIIPTPQDIGRCALKALQDAGLAP
ncbi:MAG: succinate--CoA ligase subunit alpha [Dehalococcoidia bacterium]|jgi:succinyl-CoA synthetase alpha subunit|nr:succinate--CoA ligase subunit alpha [Dehalococcoidia bacterium]